VRVRPPDCVVYLFGAGHVGRALAEILGQLPCRAIWIDERRDAFPPSVPANVATLRAGDPAAEAARAAKGAYVLVMTHSHARDQAIVEAVLRRGDFAYLGLIGSATKRARFAARLRAAGIGEAALARLVCPIGAEGIPGKEPGVIALAAAAEIMRRHRAAAGTLARSA
jgi:xanthine dehydrogenase accessory factor